ncbi:MAG: ATP-binding cassette domain-containing protein [bacterium]
MLVQLSNIKKEIGVKKLFENVSFQLEEFEKCALIGRNGIGKTTLAGIIEGKDKEYVGELNIRKGIKVIVTKQEFIGNESLTPLDYILDSVPMYRELEGKIKGYEANPTHDLNEIQIYSDSINEWHSLSYSEMADDIGIKFHKLGMTIDQMLSPISKLSGGQKRFVELLRVEYAKADLAILDEPTNHLDIYAKANFLNWMRDYKKALFIISHDRDVLHEVDRILELTSDEIKDFKGNYEKYLKINSVNIVSEVHEHEVDLKQIEQYRKQMIVAKEMKLSAHSDGSRTSAKIREMKYKKLYDDARANLNDPEFWIDKESVGNLDKKMKEKYAEFKSREIRFRLFEMDRRTDINIYDLIKIKNLSIGYSDPLFKGLNVRLDGGKKLQIRGRNGQGKTTFLNFVINLHKLGIVDLVHENTGIKYFDGIVEFDKNIRIGVYEQELKSHPDDKLDIFSLTLSDVIFKLYTDARIPINKQKVNVVLSNYLFDPIIDGDTKYINLSGGQKSRIQFIKMMINNPNLIILDEPTNHLDLPSIEELENMLAEYKGAVIYVSHDSYFAKNVGGEVITLGKQM